MVGTQPSDIYRKSLYSPWQTLGIPMGYVPPCSLSGCPLNELMYIHHQGGGKIDVIYIIDVCIYSLYHPSYHTLLNDEGKIDVMYIIDVCIYSLYHPSYHTPLNDDVCSMCMEFIVMNIIM